MSAAAITFCPPAVPHWREVAIAEQVHNNHERQPISTRFNARGPADSTGISFDDYAGMTTTVRTSGTKHTPMPTWMMSSEHLQEVITVAVELRAQVYSWPTGMTRQQRIERAQQKLDSSRPLLIQQLDKVCVEYLAAKSAGQPTIYLEREVSRLDTLLLVNENAARFVASALYLSWRCEMNSVEVAQSLQLGSPCLIRQTLSRCRRIGAYVEKNGSLPRKAARQTRKKAEHGNR